MFDSKTAAMLDWLACFGAAPLRELADVAGVSGPTAAVRLRRLETEGLITQARLLHGVPSLMTITRAGLRACGRTELAPPRISAAGFMHTLECAQVARALERSQGGRFSVHSERELRAWERAAGKLIASAELGFSPASSADVHRPDLVCLQAGARRPALPLVIEVELAVKAPLRLRAIVRGWARSRLVCGVVYFASPAALRALEVAVARERAADAVRVFPLADAGERAID